MGGVRYTNHLEVIARALRLVDPAAVARLTGTTTHGRSGRERVPRRAGGAAAEAGGGPRRPSGAALA